MKVESLEQMGAILRETRVALKVPLMDLSEALHTSHTLLRRQEHGQSTRALEILFATMRELGIEMHLELPPQVDSAKVQAVVKMNTKLRSRARP